MWPGLKGVGPTHLLPLLTSFSPNRLYLGNPMDPPDLLSVELSTSRPTQHLGRVKSKRPSIPWYSQFTGHPEPAVLLWGQSGQGSRWDSWIPGSGWVWGKSREAAVSAEEGILGLALPWPCSLSFLLLPPHQAL